MDKKRSSFAKTCNLLSQYVKDKNKGKEIKQPVVDLFPEVEKSGKVPKSVTSAQMTIFYAGKVIVIDDLPEEKAMGLVAVVGKAVNGSTTETTAVDKDSTTVHKSSAGQPSPSSLTLPPPSTTVITPIDVSDLPIARKESLGRFFEKRRDRLTSKAPYQANHGSPISSNDSGPATAATQTKKATDQWLSLAPI